MTSTHSSRYRWPDVLKSDAVKESERRRYEAALSRYEAALKRTRDRSYRVFLNWDVSGGRLRVASIEIEAVSHDEVDTSALRAIPLGELIERGRAGAVKALSGTLKRPDLTEAQREQLEALRPAYEARRGRPGRPPVPPQKLQLVADIYREAYEQRQHPTKAVEQKLGIGRSHASKLVVRARRAGLLGQTEERKPGIGEIPKTRRRK